MSRRCLFTFSQLQVGSSVLSLIALVFVGVCFLELRAHGIMTGTLFIKPPVVVMTRRPLLDAEISRPCPYPSSHVWANLSYAPYGELPAVFC